MPDATRALVQPPWRVMAEEFLKANDPERYRTMRRAGTLDAWLDDLDSRLTTSYAHLVAEIEERNPRNAGAFALQAAQEMLVRDVLKPRTSPPFPGSGSDT